MSTTAIEYLLNKKNVIILLNDNLPNFSPLFMNSNKYDFIFDLENLKNKLSQKQHNFKYDVSLLKPYGANKKLIYWNRLIQNDFKR